MRRLTLVRAALASLAAVAVCACAGLRSSQHPAVPANSPLASPVEPSPEPPAVQSDASGVNSAAPAADSAAASPPCTCVDTKTKPRLRPKPKPVHKEAPPQLATAPVVIETPSGSVVDAQVRPMSVSVMSILGKRVKGSKGEDLGRVVDVLADATGRVRIAIIDFGGFLGVGNHRIAVDWPLLRFSPDGADPSLLLSLSLKKLLTAPEYKDDPRPQTLMEPAVAAPAAVPAPAPSIAAPPEAKK